MAVREAEPVETLQQVKEAGLDREDLLGMYRNMLITRAVEERGHILYKQGKIPGSFYTGRGNEASAVGVATAMGPNDVGTPLQRDMGVHITRGIEPWRIFAQYMGRAGRADAGPRRQRPHGRLAPRAPHDGEPPAGDASRRRRDGARVQDPRRAARRRRLVRRGRVGTGRRPRGDEPRRRPAPAGRLRHRQQPVGVLDALPISSTRSTIWPTARPPTASTASSSTARTSSRSTARRSSAIEKAREGGGPTLIESVTLRMEGHAVHDDAFYVPKELFEEWARRDPIERFRTWLRDNAEMTDDEEDEITAGVKRLLNEAIQRAEESPLPDPSTVTDGRLRRPRRARDAASPMRRS